MFLTPSVYVIVVALFAGLILYAAFTDVRSLTIPNRVSASIALLFPAAVLSAPVPIDWLTALGLGAATLSVGFILFAQGWLGGGDAKLIAAIMLWAGPNQGAEFILITTAAGGILAVILWLRSRLHPATATSANGESVAEIAPSKRPIPYAVAIACGGLYVAFTLIGVGLPRLPL
ncbi:MAG: prepilin peptidase [Pseudomonadota bacterium]